MDNNKTLDEEFPYLLELPEQNWKHQHKYDLATGYQFSTILRYIIKNKCRLEHRCSLDSNQWVPGTLREFLEFATSLPLNHNPNFTMFQDYLTFWRIKHTANYSELERIIKIDNKEEF